MAKADVFQRIAEVSGCPHVEKAVVASGCPVGGMTPKAAKGEFYALLRAHLGEFMLVFDSIRGEFADALVKFGVDDGGEGRRLVSTVDENFVSTCASLRGEDDFMQILHFVYARTVDTMKANAVLWREKLEQDGHSAAYNRMSQLIEPELREAYGADAVQVRVARAVDLTLNLAFSFQRLFEQLSIQLEGREITRAEMRVRFRNSLDLAKKFAMMHRDALRKLRFSEAKRGEKGCHVEEFIDLSLFEIVDDTVQLVEDTVLDAVRFEEIDTSDGRYTCPGRRYIDQLWQWIEELSEKYIWDRFD